MDNQHLLSDRQRSIPAVSPTTAEIANPPGVEPANCTRSVLSDDELKARIAEAAYYSAQRRGFAPGKELDDWLAAECQIIEALCH